VAVPRVVEDEVADLVGPPSPLPVALGATGVGSRRRARSRLDRADGIRRRAELVGRDMRDGRRLGRGEGGVARRAREVASRRVRMTRGGPRVRHPDLAARPGPSHLDRLTGPVVVWSHGGEEREDVVRAVRRPDRESVMVVVLERAAAPDRDEPGIANLRQDHASRG
jgi:hypothetical protein